MILLASGKFTSPPEFHIDNCLCLVIRPYMEDRHFCTNDLVATCKSSSSNTVSSLEGLEIAYFGVYDGHSGYSVAEYLEQKLHKAFYDVLLAVQRTQQRGQTLRVPPLLSSPLAAPSSEPTTYLSTSFHDACTSTDREIIEIDFRRQKQGLHSGTLASEVFGGSVAAMMAIVRDRRMSSSTPLTCVLAHVGDCRAVLSDNGVRFFIVSCCDFLHEITSCVIFSIMLQVAVTVTEDHKPTLPKEKERIEVIKSLLSFWCAFDV